MSTQGNKACGEPDEARVSGVGDIVVDAVFAAFVEGRDGRGARSDPFGADGSAEDLASWLELWELPAIRLRFHRLAVLLRAIETGRWWFEGDGAGRVAVPTGVREVALVSPVEVSELVGIARISAEGPCDVHFVVPTATATTRTRPVGARIDAPDGFAPTLRVAIEDRS